MSELRQAQSSRLFLTSGCSPGDETEDDKQQGKKDKSSIDSNKHPLDEPTLSLLQHQLHRNTRSLYTQLPKPPTPGFHGHLLKLTLAGFGYTLVGKGTAGAEQHKLAVEARIYTQMPSLQGQCVPVCFGVCASRAGSGSRCAISPPGLDHVAIDHVLLLSHAGVAVGVEPVDEEGKKALEKEVGKEVLVRETKRTFEEINKVGMEREDDREKHQFWCRERGRVFMIDFEKDDLSELDEQAREEKRKEEGAREKAEEDNKHREKNNKYWAEHYKLEVERQKEGIEKAEEKAKEKAEEKAEEKVA